MTKQHKPRRMTMDELPPLGICTRTAAASAQCRRALMRLGASFGDSAFKWSCVSVAADTSITFIDNAGGAAGHLVVDALCRELETVTAYGDAWVMLGPWAQLYEPHSSEAAERWMDARLAASRQA